MTYCSQIIAEKEKEIQQLKKEYEKTIQLLNEQAEKRNDYIEILEKQVEAAKTIFKEQLLSDLITEKEYIEIFEKLESAQNSEETTK